MSNMENTILKWLADEGFFKKKIPDENSNFHFIVNYPEGHVIDVIQPKGKEDMVVIGCATNVSPEHTSQIQNLNNKEKEKFIWDFRFSLNNFLVDFQLQHPDNVLQSYVISDQIYEDGLTKDRLILVIKKVFRAKLQGLWKIQESFGSAESNAPGKSQPSDSMFV